MSDDPLGGVGEGIAQAPEQVLETAKGLVENVPIVGDLADNIPGVGGEGKGVDVPIVGDVMESAKEAGSDIVEAGGSAVGEAAEATKDATPAQEGGKDQGIGIG